MSTMRRGHYDPDPSRTREQDPGVGPRSGTRELDPGAGPGSWTRDRDPGAVREAAGAFTAPHPGSTVHGYDWSLTSDVEESVKLVPASHFSFEPRQEHS